MDSTDLTAGLIAFLICFGLYMIPAFVAFARSHHNTLAIFMLNFFLGLTGLGWVIALVWACTKVEKG